jgi:glucose/arabinose dehydrogenase
MMRFPVNQATLAGYGRLLALSLLAGAGATLVVNCGRAQEKPVRAERRTSSLVLTGHAALGDWTTDAPGVRRRITTADLPPPYETPSVDNGPNMVRRPEGAWPQAPEGFKVEQFAEGLENPRVIVTAPNGDLFVAESRPGRVKLLRDGDGNGKPELITVFASELTMPFGIAFYPPGPNPTQV